MTNGIYAFVMILIIALVTMALRFAPFLIFRGNKPVPKFVNYLGRVLPYAIMAMLVVYCLKGISFLKAPYGIPELISVALVVVLHRWKRNTLLSIISGTICYMLLIQFVL